MNRKTLKTDCQYLLPKYLLTRLAGFFASIRMGRLTTALINGFIKHYKVNTREISGKISDFKTFNDFFARPLKPTARPINADKDTIVFPADGTISRFGTIENKFMLQAKNHYYTVEALLADKKEAAAFKNGEFATIYLSPKDYHRVHIPFGGTLTKMLHVPGELFSVTPFNAENIPELFARNERVVCFFDTAIGKMAVVLVGATIVRSIATTWAGVVAPNKNKGVTVYDYADQPHNFDKGAEIGKFFMGSTVICLFEKNKIDFIQNLEAGQTTRVGTAMAAIRKQK
ncbi:MAG: archaetidylserine decarboxylase [Pseudomonadota bacterium]|nr:archaetidylserine decarboxylase [Pseudomonadota bacterium]